MDEKTTQMLEALKRDPGKLRALMQSRDGQALLGLLTQGDRGAGLQQAAQSAARGEPGEMVEMVKRVMASPQGAALVERINKAVQE